MILTRRRIMEAGGGILAAFVVGPAAAATAISSRSPCGARPTARMSGSTRSGIHIQPGQTVRWTNRDPGNSHTVTSYHPEIFERPLRIPAGAKPWNSDYLLPNESFSMTFTVEGVYDYYCVPHEHAGMVGRIVVGTPAAGRRRSPATPEAGLTPLPEVALNGFPSVEEIIAKSVVVALTPNWRIFGLPRWQKGYVDMQMAILRQQAELGGQSDERACRAGAARRRERRSRAHQAQQPAAVPGGARRHAQRRRGRGRRSGNLCAGVHEARHRSGATRSSRPGSRGSLSTRRWGACAAGGRPPSLQNWTPGLGPRRGSDHVSDLCRRRPPIASLPAGRSASSSRRPSMISRMRSGPCSSCATSRR